MELKEFITKHQLFTEFDGFKRQADAFAEEMEAGLRGEPSSLEMIPTYISLDNVSAATNRRVIAIDAGGTNLRISLVAFDAQGTPKVEEFYNHPMLGTQGEIDIDAFFDGLAEYLQPVAAKSTQIGFCFSFPCEILPNLDGRVIVFDKEIQIRNSPGAILGEGLRNALARRGLPSDHSVVVINDTVATLLGGRAAAHGHNFGSYIGYILGTGTNTCYAEENGRILKNEALRARPGSSLINMESGGYNKLPRNDVERAFDATTSIPGHQVLEKMISGVYQGAMLSAYIRQAAQEGALPVKFAEFAAVEAREVSRFLDDPYGDNPLARAFETQEEKRALYTLMDAFFERAAATTVVNLAGVMQKAGIGKDPLAPVCITADGSTFYKSRLLHEKVCYYMVEYVQKRMGIYAQFKQVENVTLAGTAFAALLG